MSLTRHVNGEDLIRDNVFPFKYVVASYAAPAVGDLVKLDTTSAATGGHVLHCADTNPAIGVIVSTNNGNGTLSVALFNAGVRAIFEFSGTCNVGDKVVCSVPSGTYRGTVLPERDRVTQDNTNGTGAVVGKDATSPAGTGTVVVQW